MTSPGQSHLFSDSSPAVSLATVLCLMDLLVRPPGTTERPLVGGAGCAGGMESPLVGTVVRLETEGEVKL